MAHILGAKRYQYFEKETGSGSDWGTRPTTPVLVHCPTSSCGIKLVRNVTKHNPFIGTPQRRHAQNPNSLPQGSITMPLYGSVPASPGSKSFAQYFMELATDSQDTLDPRPSMRVFDITRDGSGTTVGGHEFTGLRVNKMTLKGSADSGFLELTLDLIGKTGIALQASADALPDDRDQLLEFYFSDVVFTLGGSAINIDSFEWTIDWGLKPKFLNSTRPSKLSAQANVQTLTVTPLKDSATYDAYMRLQAQTELTNVLTIKGLHSGTGTVATNYCQGAFTFTRCSLLNADEVLNQEDYGMQPLIFDVLKPDTSANQVTPVWSDVA